MRGVLVIGLLTTALALSGCGDDEGADTSTVGAPAVPELAEAAATAFYDAAGQRDCITMREASAPDEQREDDAWAECIDRMLTVVGDDFDYDLGDPEVGEGRVTYTVGSSSLVDGARVEREDPLVLVLVGETWLVDDSVVTDGA